MVHGHIALLKNKAQKNNSQRAQQRGTLDNSVGTFRYNATNGFTFEPDRGNNVNHLHSNFKFNDNKTQFSMRWSPWEAWGLMGPLLPGFPLNIKYTNLTPHPTPKRKKRRLTRPPTPPH